MQTLFYTYEGKESQPHESLYDALEYASHFGADKIMEVLHRDDMSVEFAWDRSPVLGFANALANVMKAARDEQT